MVSIRTHSIQDILKNINRSLSFYDILALFGVFAVLFLASISFFLFTKESKPVVYMISGGIDNEGVEASHIFASVSGKTFTYSWCGGASRIKEENKIFFKNEQEALQSGRTLSKLCQ